VVGPGCVAAVGERSVGNRQLHRTFNGFCVKSCGADSNQNRVMPQQHWQHTGEDFEPGYIHRATRMLFVG